MTEFSPVQFVAEADEAPSSGAIGSANVPDRAREIGAWSRGSSILLAAALLGGAAVVAWNLQAVRERDTRERTRDRLAARPRRVPSAADIRVG